MKRDFNSIKKGVSIEKIAYYVKRLYQRDEDIKNVISVIRSQFRYKDIKEFASKYRECNNDDDVRYIANLLYSTPLATIDTYLRNIV